MTLTESLVSVVKSKLAWASTMAGILLHSIGVGIDPMTLWNLVVSTSTYWFGGGTVFAFRLAPEFAFIPTSTVQQAYIALVVVYLAVLAWKGYEKLQSARKS